MDMVSQIFLFVGVILAISLLYFGFSSLQERRGRAAVISFLLSGTTILYFSAICFWVSNPELVMTGTLVAIVVGNILFFMPVGRTQGLKVESSTLQVDERDTGFAREELTNGTERYEVYYSAHPEFREADDRFRELPDLLQPGGRYYDPVRSEGIRKTFATIKEMTTRVDGEVVPDKKEIAPEDMTTEIKEMVHRLGGSSVGVALLDQRWVYSHVGRGPEEYGAPIKNNHKFAIVFTLEMNYFQVEHAPDLPVTEEAGLQYLRGAQISTELASYIRSLGHSARAHISDSNYQIMLPPVAADAGLGELGRMGYLISPVHGARVRLGGVTTDLPLVVDKPITFGVQDFCASCLKCADNCPASAISTEEPVEIRGVYKWPLEVEQCLRYWRLAGTDCGLCMKVCPYSHPQSLAHNIVRAAIKRSPIARQLAIWGDDLFYGRRMMPG